MVPAWFKAIAPGVLAVKSLRVGQDEQAILCIRATVGAVGAIVRIFTSGRQDRRPFLPGKGPVDQASAGIVHACAIDLGAVAVQPAAQRAILPGDSLIYDIKRNTVKHAIRQR